MGFLRRGNYEENTVDMVVMHVRQSIRSYLEQLRYAGRTEEESAAFREAYLQSYAKHQLLIAGKCYVGLTADPVASLSAHGIDIFAESTFFCIDIPKDLAQECKAAVTALEGYEPVTDPANDRTETPFSQLYLYIYAITERTDEHPNLSAVTSMAQLPERPVCVRVILRSGALHLRYLEEMREPDCDALLDELFTQIEAQAVQELCIVHRMHSRMTAEFGDGCCIINYDAGTSQAGWYQSYRSGSASRKKVQLYTQEYPEYMLCRNFSVLRAILRYYLLRERKPGARQNVKWVKMSYLPQ